MLPRVLKNFNLFIDGTGYAGRVQEVTLPKLTHRTEEFKMGGLDTPVQVDMGLEKLESDITLSEYDTYVIKLFGIEDNSLLPISLRGSGLDPVVNAATDLFGLTSSGQITFTLRGGLTNEMENKVVPVVVYFEGSIIELDFGQWKAGENAPLRLRLALRYYRLQVNQEDLVEIDVDNMVRKIDGYDQIQLAQGRYRSRSSRRRDF